MKHQNRKYDERIQDAANIIPKDEPVFLIRAQDLVSGDALRHWAQLNDDAGGSPEVSTAICDHALLMDKWPVKKLAD